MDAFYSFYLHLVSALNTFILKRCWKFYFF